MIVKLKIWTTFVIILLIHGGCWLVQKINSILDGGDDGAGTSWSGWG